MSLDVYLMMADETIKVGSGIFVRADGATKEISRAEWDEKFPGREPIVLDAIDESGEVYSRNITHNLNTMADAAGIYKALWRPEEIGITTAVQLIHPLTDGLALLRAEPERFLPMNPSNGWGSYGGLCEFVEDYLDACKRYPTATVKVSR